VCEDPNARRVLRMHPSPPAHTGAGTVSAPGGAGHALQFRDHVLLKKDFKVGRRKSSRSTPGSRVRGVPRSCSCSAGGGVMRNSSMRTHWWWMQQQQARAPAWQRDQAATTLTAPGCRVCACAPLQDFPTTAMTFEAWVSSSDFCHAGEGAAASGACTQGVSLDHSNGLPRQQLPTAPPSCACELSHGHGP
jgi:hypothetical protein